MRRLSIACSLLLAAMLLAPLSGRAELELELEVEQEPTAYRLEEASAWVEGCIVGPCLCPVSFLDDLTGAFKLVELPTLEPGPWRLFDLRDLEWTLRRGQTRIKIRGSGSYRTAAPILDEHRLILDLELDGDPIGTLDSGDVVGAMSFPQIAIQALSEGQCFQQGALLVASPVPEPSLGLQQLAGLISLLALWRLRRASGRHAHA